MQEVNDEFVNVGGGIAVAASKPIPPCCLKSSAAISGNEGKYHATVVSGWFSQVLPLDNGLILQLHMYTNTQLPDVFLFKINFVAGEEDMYYHNPMWPGINFNELINHALHLHLQFWYVILYAGECHSIKVDEILFKDNSDYQEVLIFKVWKLELVIIY